MALIKKILLPVDFSEKLDVVIPLVRELVESHHAELHLLHVVENLEHYANFYVPHPSVEQMQQELNQGAQRRMEEFIEQHFAQLSKVDSAVLVGDPAQQIVNYAREQDLDLIVMSTHGRKGLEHVIFGSVAENVVRNSAVPVLTVNPHKVSGA